MCRVFDFIIVVYIITFFLISCFITKSRLPMGLVALVLVLATAIAGSNILLLFSYQSLV